MSGVRALVPELPRGAWTLLAADAISSLGSGMTLPFLLVYLHDVRGLGLGAAGLAVSAVALAGFAGNPIGGSLADRFGGRATMLAGLVFCAAGCVALAFTTQAWQAFAASATLGLGAAIAWPARSALLATLVPSERRSSAYALQHAATNVGLGAGALVAALIVENSSAGTFQALYLLDAASFVAVVPLLARLAVPAHESRAAASTPARAAYRSILRDRAFRRLWWLTALLVGVGFAQYSAAFPAFATGEAGLDAHQLALAFAANTVAVVLAQLPVLGVLRGAGGRARSRSPSPRRGSRGRSSSPPAASSRRRRPRPSSRSRWSCSRSARRRCRRPPRRWRTTSRPTRCGAATTARTRSPGRPASPPARRLPAPSSRPVRPPR